MADFPATAGDRADRAEPDEPGAESFDEPLLLDDVLDDEASPPPDEEPLDDVSEDVLAEELALLAESEEARASLSADFNLAPLASARESLR